MISPITQDSLLNPPACNWQSFTAIEPLFRIIQLILIRIRACWTERSWLLTEHQIKNHFSLIHQSGSNKLVDHVKSIGLPNNSSPQSPITAAVQTFDIPGVPSAPPSTLTTDLSHLPQTVTQNQESTSPITVATLGSEATHIEFNTYPSSITNPGERLAAQIENQKHRLKILLGDKHSSVVSNFLVNKSTLEVEEWIKDYNLYLLCTQIETFKDETRKIQCGIERGENFNLTEHVKALREKINAGQLNDISFLILDDMNLTELPPEIGQFTKLESLTLQNNHLTFLPPEIKQLNQLVALNVFNNKLIALPVEIGQLVGLCTLNLEKNNLTILPSELGELRNLTELDVSSNNLTTLPNTIGQLSKLVVLNVSINKLTTLPREIGQLTRLEYLYLGRNELKSLPPEIGKLTYLMNLYLDHNKLTTLPDRLGKLTNLVDLCASFNELESLTGKIGDCKAIIHIDLEHNKLKSLPKELAKLPCLQKIFLIGNDLKFLSAALRNCKMDYGTRKLPFVEDRVD